MQAPADLFSSAAGKNGTAVASASGVRVRYDHDGHNYDTTITSNALILCDKGPNCPSQLLGRR